MANHNIRKKFCQKFKNFVENIKHEKLSDDEQFC